MVSILPESSANLSSASRFAILLGMIPSVVIAVVAPLDLADPVGPHRRVMEQGRTLHGRVPRGKPFESIKQAGLLIVGPRTPVGRVPSGLAHHEFKPSRNRRFGPDDPALASSGETSGRRPAAMPWPLFRRRDGNQQCCWQLKFRSAFYEAR
jgi:hypothetical protein